MVKTMPEHKMYALFNGDDLIEAHSCILDRGCLVTEGHLAYPFFVRIEDAQKAANDFVRADKISCGFKELEYEVKEIKLGW